MQQKIAVCPCNKTFQFSGKCIVTTCQYHNVKTKSGCLELDIAAASTKLSDTQILHFKILPNQDKFESKSYDGKFAFYARKKAVVAAKSNMLLYLYCSWIKTKLKPSEKFGYEVGISNVLDEMLRNFPFNQPELSFEPWMLYYAANPKVYQKFIDEQQRGGEESVLLINVLCLTPGKHKNLVYALKNFNNAKKSFEKQKIKHGAIQ